MILDHLSKVLFLFIILAHVCYSSDLSEFEDMPYTQEAKKFKYIIHESPEAHPRKGTWPLC